MKSLQIVYEKMFLNFTLFLKMVFSLNSYSSPLSCDDDYHDKANLKEYITAFHDYIVFGKEQPCSSKS